MAICFLILIIGVAISYGARHFGLFGSDRAKAAKTAPTDDPCAKCTVEKIPLEELTCEPHGDMWRFLGHRCVGFDHCGSCKVANCESAEMGTPPPVDGCNRCSSSGD